MMLGTMEYDTRMFGNGSKYTSCVNHDENFDLKDALKTAVGQISGRITDVMYFLTEGFALSSVPLLVMNATMPPGLTLSSVFAKK